MTTQKILGKYWIESALGGGGEGKVYRATQEGAAGFSRTVAIKTLRSSKQDNEISQQIFAREARIIAFFNHRNIVQVYDFACEQDLYFLVMEFVDGLTLEQLIKVAGEEIPVWLKLHIAAEICQGLNYAHNLHDRNGIHLAIVHRDIKPSNILLSRQGDVKISDFGLAKMSAIAAENYTQMGMIKGTPRYMSPEQRNGQPATSASDIFSLALVVYELFTGKILPKTIRAGQQEVSSSSGISVLKIPEAPQLEEIFQQCLQPDPQLRPKAAWLAQKFEQLMLSLRPSTVTSSANIELAALVDKFTVQAALGVKTQFSEVFPKPLTLSLGTAQDQDQDLDQSPFADAAEAFAPVAIAPPEKSQLEPRPEVKAALILAEASTEEMSKNTDSPTSLEQQPKFWRWVAGGAFFSALLISAVLIFRPTPRDEVRENNNKVQEQPEKVENAKNLETARNEESLQVKADADSPAAASPILEIKAESKVGTKAKAKSNLAISGGGTGWFSVNAAPWMNVFLDDKSLGTTPIFHQAVPSGVYTLRLVSANGQKIRRKIIIRPKEHLNLGILRLTEVEKANR